MNPIQVLTFPYPRKENPYHYLLYGFLEIHGIKLVDYEFSLKNLLKNCNDKTVIHLHWLSSVLCSPFSTLKFCMLLLAAKVLGNKIVWTAHNLGGHEGKDPWASIGRNFIIYISDAIIVHSFYAKKEIVKDIKFAKKTFFIEHGNYMGWYPNNTTRSNARNLLDIKDNKLTFLLFGMIRPYKGHEIILDNLDKLRNDINIIIAGLPCNSNLENKIKKYAEIDKRIKHYMYYINDNDVQYFFNSSDVAIFPFNSITTSGSLILALSFGMPIISMKSGMIPELVTYNNGIVANSIKEFLIAMNQADKLPLEKMRNEALRKAKKLCWEKIAQKHFHVYSKIVK